MNAYIMYLICFIIGFVAGAIFAYKIHDHIVAARYRTKQIMEDKYNYKI